MPVVHGRKKKMRDNKEGSKKMRRVYAKGVECSGTGRKDKGKGKGLESGKKWKRVEDEDDDEYEEVELEGSWRAFVMAQMMQMDAMLGSLIKENEELRREVWEMWKENMEDRREYLREVGRIRKDVRVMESWVQQIVKWVEEKSWDQSWGAGRQRRRRRKTRERWSWRRRLGKSKRWKKRQRKRQRKRRWKRRRETEMWRW